MKKLFVLVALIGLCVPTFAGCGSGSPTVIEPVAEDDGALAAEQQRQYEEQMRSGGSSRATAPRSK
ncbi:hypothetical protein Enr13x_14040 [Stieleria neptunia]|uniref:Secreted protein n=1 Tax=Stieleria neptunia TaxID=2527979 RepID=A0A518HL38_9BACT|nr:hypothetical protein [Stieleria neptunia]QDV41561.1 hypothetical protein Enr13x_14040 [Stieleria neptunia]